MLGMKKNTLCVLLSLLFAGAVSAQDAGTPPAAAEAHKRAIKAELSKPVALNVAGAAADLDPKPISQIAASTAGTATNPASRFVERPGTGSSKSVATAPKVTLPEGPLGKAPGDLKTSVLSAQRAGGVGLDSIQRDMNLPGLKKDDPSLKPFVLHTRNGVNEIVRLSGRLLNRIATPFVKPVVVDESGSTVKVIGSDVYFMPAGETPIGLYIVDEVNTGQTISLTVVPAYDIPGQSIIVKLEDLRATQNLALAAATPEEGEIAQPRASDYTGYVRTLMTQAVRGKINGFNPVPLEGGIARLGTIEVVPEVAFTGSVVDIYRYVITNKGAEAIDLVETAFYRKGVKAVSFFPSQSLTPEGSGYVFIMADKPESPASLQWEGQ
jgi:conjugal transfer pilus assembly protein TraK